ncbi:sugar phosphate isomerase/epimerase family protein [Micromonospora sp. NPDC050417]|uniref:sugar phosphate isomerase/epimerase family protein n=1 Tax=Micromonospora sp. NPDC050417 TaxID=3364280 RepID=UPI0037A35216
MTCLVGLADWRLPVSGVEAVRLTASVGADGLQVDLGGPGRGEWIDAPGRIDALRAEAGEHGVRILALGGNHLNDIGLTSGSRMVRPLLQRLLDAAVALGVPLVFVPSFRRSAIDGPAALTRTAAVLGWAAAQAQERGLVLASENVLSGEQARVLADEVDSSAFRLVLDTFNPVAAGLRTDALVASLADLLADQVHLKDGPPDRGPSPLLGAGTGRLVETLTALREHRVPVHAFVLENDYRGADTARLAADLAWARRRAQHFTSTGAGA